MRVVEKQLREEVINRCIEFLDITIHFILYIEQIYSTDIFEKRLKYNQIVYECQDVDVQNYISDFLNSIKALLRKQLLDQIAFVIMGKNERNILRRYLIELYPIVDQSSSTIHPNGNLFLADLDSIFSTCLIELIRQNPVSPLELAIDEEEIQWKLQMRLCQRENAKFEVEDTFYEQWKLIDSIPWPLKQIKSVHSQRLNIQLMCQNKK